VHTKVQREKDSVEQKVLVRRKERTNTIIIFKIEGFSCWAGNWQWLDFREFLLLSGKRGEMGRVRKPYTCTMQLKGDMSDLLISYLSAIF